VYLERILEVNTNSDNPMKRAIILKAIFLFSFIQISEMLLSQNCYVGAIYPQSMSLPANQGSDYIMIEGFPNDCTPAIDCPSWVNVYKTGESTYIIEWEANTGNARNDLIYVGDNDWISISQAAGPLTGGQIRGPSGQTSMSICYNTSPGTLINYAGASGGGCSTYTYQWQVSTNGTSFSDLSGANGYEYSPGSLTASMYFRRKVSCSGVNPAYSNTIAIQVYSSLSGGSVSGAQTICYNTDGSLISNSSLASGGPGSFTYQWEKSENGGASWSNISGATSTSYDPPVLAVTTNYHRVATASGGCGSVNSNIITKTVNPILTSGSIGEDQTINYNSIPSTLENISFPSGGGGQFSYQWQSSVNGVNSWNNLESATDHDYSPGELITNTYFRRVETDISSYTCGFVNSNSVSIKIKTLANADSTQNYIYIREPNVPIDDSLFLLVDADSIRANIQYFDGLGRPIQNIQISASPNKNDVITPFYYDKFGRESIKYLPFTKPSNNGVYIDSAISKQFHFYDTANYFPGETANAKTVFENSPLNRILEQGAPGKYWQPSASTSDTIGGHTVKYVYGLNGVHSVLFWKVVSDTLVNDGGESYNSRHYYPKNTILKTITKDENWRYQATRDSCLYTSIEYKDFRGNIILKRSFIKSGTNIDSSDTYYVYDDFNLLRYVLSPKSVQNIGSTTSFSSENALIKGLCYYYKYDGRKRMITKQLPGADPIYMIYDKRDRLVLIQDGNNRKSNRWVFTKYDQLNRPIMSGIYEHPDSINQASMQTYLDGIQSTTYRQYEIRTNGSGNIFRYSNVTFPDDIQSGDVYTVTYYDSYDFSDLKQFDDASNISDYSDSQGDTHYFDFLNGLVTGTKVKVPGTSTYITTTNYYDDHYRIIQSLKSLYDDPNGKEIISNRYNFVGNVIRNKQKQKFDGDSATIDKYYTYDHIGRLLKTESEINGSNKLTIAEMTYNELGQLTKKGLHKNGNSYLQEVDYVYNIRGWLCKINDPSTLGTDLFAMQLLYEDPSQLANLTKEKQSNGNISGIIWNRKTNSSTSLKSAYSFKYDALNRIVNNYYGEGATLTNSNKYREYDYSYDLNGNIQALKRNNGIGTGNQIDNLSYTYFSSLSNQLASVSDNSDTSGFRDRNTTGDDYSYDNNGNLTKDLNKGFGTIAYNYLNLPEKVKKGSNDSIIYYYDAMGTKLRQMVRNGSTITGKYYFDGFEYDNSKNLNLIHTDEGVIEVSSGPVFKYEYFLKDHLGNTRIAFTDSTGSPKITQSIDYYPFGLQFEPTNMSGTNQYLYNGKELQDALELDWYDYGARFYDPQIGRWNTQDAFAEKYYPLTSYQYGANNPIKFIDVNGDSINLANLYAKGKDGMFNHSSEIFAFELFASTKEGGQYILDYAQKGFSLQGVYIQDLSISADKSGSLNDQGVDVNLSVKDISNGVADTHDNWMNPESGVPFEARPERLKINIGIKPIAMSSNLGDDHFNTLYSVDGISHEFGLHADLLNKNFTNSSFTIEPYSHDRSSYEVSSYLNGYRYSNTGILGNTNAIRILNAVQRMPIFFNKDQPILSSYKLFEKYVWPGIGSGKN
jgi:RHS repeat-associated protein